ncbi:divalent-cation tolerance protein CutA [uncultured Ornithinimicrobium sp.]|uniref:divalent-cation tolerance protein CutA n=1 Tax=uncultured Ornithinimicrobium sp. TaxID=259307 RepID=UPI002595399D|nr:divalent-cation tolerance protein CutA [uncultured Ornithinimicrobium sp.]
MTDTAATAGPDDATAQELPALVEAHVSVPDTDTAQRIASDLVARQLAACVQVLGPMTSVYTWEGEVHRSEEWLLLAKTTAASFPALTRAVRALHGYEVPEVVAVPITQALGEYAAWVRQHADGIDDAELSGRADAPG